MRKISRVLLWFLPDASPHLNLRTMAWSISCLSPRCIISALHGLHPGCFVSDLLRFFVTSLGQAGLTDTLMPSPFPSLPRENWENDYDIFDPLKGKDVYREQGQEYVLLQGNSVCQSSRSYTEPDNLTIGKSWEMECVVRPHALFGIKSSGSAEKVEKVRIKGRKCLFAVLRSPGGDMRWGGIPAEWEIVGQQKNMMDNVQQFYNSVGDAGMTYCLGKKHTRWQIQNLLMNTNGCECLNSIMKEKLRTRKTRQHKNIIVQGLQKMFLIE